MLGVPLQFSRKKRAVIPARRGGIKGSEISKGANSTGGGLPEKLAPSKVRPLR